MAEVHGAAPSGNEFARRLGIVAALSALTPVLLLAIELPSRTLSVPVFGAPLIVRLDTDLLQALFLPTVVVVGTDWALRAHPEVQRGHVALLFPFWIAPGLAAFALALLLARLDTWAGWSAVLLLGVAAVAALVVVEYAAVSPAQPTYPLARLVVSGVSYAIALGAFTLIYATRERSIVTATGAMSIAFLLSVDLLGSAGGDAKRALLHAAVVALLIGQATWAMNYWNISAWSAGVLLLAAFYVATNLALLELGGELSRDAVVEYGVVVGVAVVVAAILHNVR